MLRLDGQGEHGEEKSAEEADQDSGTLVEGGLAWILGTVTVRTSWLSSPLPSPPHRGEGGAD
ncbi:hypothetical protein GCM10007913_20650 [Devosia yakushimensis]|uniref:Uncharacterized protein n=1 Tax=Devosia yakushimensis TaxID=470028 RepID=A0ABQ5UDR9_9HYPH|nr:hypothetical protein GCM10007913_20650 [Devosia yakushimensis]